MNKILYLVQLPPPLHGVSKMNGYVVNSAAINNCFSSKVMSLQFSKRNDQLEKLSFQKVLSFITHGIRLLKLLGSFKPNLVYFTLTPTGLAFFRDAVYVLILKIYSPKIVFHLHGKGIHNSVLGSRIKRVIYKEIFKNTSVICLSHLLANDIKEVYMGAPYIVPNGIKMENRVARFKDVFDQKTPMILYLSNYIENKGIVVLIEALSILKLRNIKFRARLVGAPSNLSMARLNQIVLDCALTEEVEIVGPVYGESKIEEFLNADIFVMPSYNDAFPLVALEAMQFGLPIVSTTEGSIPDIVIHNETGFIVERKNSPALAEKIAVLLENPVLRSSMGSKGYERFLSEFTLDRFECNLLAVFNSIFNVDKISL